MTGCERTTNYVVVNVTWPDDLLEWSLLPRSVRNGIRDHMDAIADLVLAAHGDAS